MLMVCYIPYEELLTTCLGKHLMKMQMMTNMKVVVWIKIKWCLIR